MKFNKNEDGFCRRWSKKITAIKKLGGRCANCGNENIFCLSFHHVQKKEADMYRLISSDAKQSRIDKELKKCVLLCINCHRLEHNSYSNIAKIKLLQIKQGEVEEFHCQKCNLKSKNTFVFDFHHIAKDKKFIINYACGNNGNIVLPIETVLAEIDKCIVLCANCHALEHAELEKFDRLKSAIEKKLVEGTKNKEIPKKKVIDLFWKGMYASQIARKLKCGTTVISRILRASGCYKEGAFNKKGTIKTNKRGL